ncbi:hypothetical protein D3C79_669030 [compost metagenome]
MRIDALGIVGMNPGGGEAVAGPAGGQLGTLPAARQIGAGQDQRLDPGGAGAGHQFGLFAGKLGAGEVETNVDHELMNFQ